MALENNPSLRVQRLETEIVRTREDDARAVFDPDLSGSLSRRRQERRPAFFRRTPRRMRL